MWLLVSLAVLATPVTEKFAATSFTTIDVPSARGDLFAEHFATRLMEQGVSVTTPSDVTTMLGLERQRQLLSCSDGSSCIAELTGALGVSALITGQVAKLELGYQVMVKVLDAKDAHVRFAKSARVDSERGVFEVLDAWALLFVGKAPPRNWTPLVPMVAGVIAGGIGAGFMVSANQSLLSLNQRDAQALSYADAVAAKDLGAKNQAIGIGLVAGGGAAMVAGLVWLFVTTPQAPTALIVPSPNGVAVVGVWP
jgi:hypothetical protein